MLTYKRHDMYLHNSELNAGDGTRHEPTQLTLIYDTMVRPFVEPFLNILVSTFTKIVTAATVVVFMIIGTIMDLIQTPIDLWVGLILLSILDFVSGTIRAIFDKRITFSIHRWGRSAYKLTSYAIFIIATSVAGNMYPNIFGWLQYIIVAMLVAIELDSISRHWKAKALFKAAFKMIKDHQSTAGKDFMDVVQDIDDQIIKERYEQIIEKDKKEETKIL